MKQCISPLQALEQSSYSCSALYVPWYTSHYLCCSPHTGTRPRLSGDRDLYLGVGQRQKKSLCT